MTGIVNIIIYFSSVEISTSVINATAFIVYFSGTFKTVTDKYSNMIEKNVTRITLFIYFRHLCSCETSIQNGPNFLLCLYRMVLIKELNLLSVNSDITAGETNKMTQMKTQNMAEN